MGDDLDMGRRGDPASTRGAHHSNACASSGGRSLFLANSAAPPVAAGRAHSRSHTGRSLLRSPPWPTPSSTASTRAPPLDLAEIDTADTSAAPGGKAETREATEPLVARLAELQDVLWARQDERVLVVLQGIDTSGKGGTVKHVFGAVNPAGLRVTSFKSPTEDELAHDYLWRVHANVPASGEIGVFDRSHYEDVLVGPGRSTSCPRTRWRRRYDHINDFERLLADEGTTIVKLFLHISKDEQKRAARRRGSTTDEALEVQASATSTPARMGRLPGRLRGGHRAARAPSTRRGTSSPPTRSGTGTGPWPRSSSTALEAHGPRSGPSPDDLDGIVID